MDVDVRDIIKFWLHWIQVPVLLYEQGIFS